MKQFTIALVAAASPAVAAMAGTPVQVEITGFVEFNQISGPPLGNVSNGADATISFMLDSDLFTNGTMFPTRGYTIEHASFELAIDAESLGLQTPFPVGQRPYFVLRDNDPAVDGFFLDMHPDAGFPTGLPLEQTGIFGQFLCNFYVTYGGTTLSSLDILDAVGTYDFTGLTVFNFTIDDGPFNAMGLIFEQMTISVVAPSCPWDCGDNDGVVGINDFLALLADWGTVGSPCDFNGNGVDVVDFLDLLANWGPCP